MLSTYSSSFRSVLHHLSIILAYITEHTFTSWVTSHLYNNTK